MTQSSASDLPSRSSLARVVTRAAVDSTFRRLLLSDPRSAVFDELGVDLPTTVRVRFVERDPDVDLDAVHGVVVAAQRHDRAVAAGQA